MIWILLNTRASLKCIWSPTSWDPWEKFMRAMFMPVLIISFDISTDREAGPALGSVTKHSIKMNTTIQNNSAEHCYHDYFKNKWLDFWVIPTDCADDARVAGHRRHRVDVQQAQVLQEGLCHRRMHLLCLEEGSARIRNLHLRHGWACVC